MVRQVVGKGQEIYINLFYVTNLVERKEVTIEYCPTDEMMAD